MINLDFLMIKNGPKEFANVYFKIKNLYKLHIYVVRFNIIKQKISKLIQIAQEYCMTVMQLGHAMT